jgi:predicted acyltransferase
MADGARPTTGGARPTVEAAEPRVETGEASQSIAASPSVLGPRPSALKPEQSALNLNPDPSALDPRPSALTPAPSALDPQASAPRLASLDLFRGATVAAMLLVNNPGSWSSIYWPLGHAEWHGWTPTDLIFPFFLFVVGITTELSRREPRRILRRGATIVLLGLLLNWFPFFWWGKMPDATLLERIAYRIEHLRFAGVLQRIGIVYAISALLATWTSRRQQVAIVVAILLGYWAILATGPLAPPEATVAAAVDRAVLGTDHIWASSKTWDPEGPLSTLPAVATAMLGILAAPYVTAKRIRALLLAGALGIAVGLAWDRLFPINKNLWTSSYVALTAGFAAVMLAICVWIVDVKQWRGWTRPFVVYGVNPLVAFVGSGIMARLLGIIKIDGRSLQAVTFSYYKPHFDPYVASLLWGLTFVLFWLVLLWLLHRRNIILRV